jgi:hypothetical protein
VICGVAVSVCMGEPITFCILCVVVSFMSGKIALYSGEHARLELFLVEEIGVEILFGAYART